jgi:membrane-anchored mycosin MYCP
MPTASPARFRTDQIVVATPHIDLVLREVRAFRRQPKSVQPGLEHEGLGLSVIDVKPAGRRRDHGAALDGLMAAVRTSCAGKYAGWVPTMGKNRLLDRVDGAGHIDGGGVDNIAGGVAGAGHIDGGGGGLPEQARKDEFKLAKEKDLGRRVKVAVLDTRIYRHPALDGRLEIDGRNERLANADGVPYSAGHATFVAGLIIQRAPHVILEVHNALNDQGQATAWDVACKMVDLAHTGVHVLNLSMGCFTDDGAPPLLFKRAVEVLAPGMVIVAAAGNHGGGGSSYDVTPKTPFWPAALDDVVAVGALTRNGKRAEFSPNTPWVTLSAPGVGVVSTFLDGDVKIPAARGGFELRPYNGFAKWSGTSFAAATITGKIAAGTIPGERGPGNALNDLLGE